MTMGLIDGLWNKLLGDPNKLGGNKALVKATARDAARGTDGAPSSARDQALDAIRQNQGRIMTPEREKLISDAMAVHRAKQKILADLSDEERRKLMVMAMRALMNEGREPDGK
jgi:hypothetical protein